MSETEILKSNIPEFSVGELANSLKRTIEETFSRVRVRGELSRVSIASSGHMYSALKDDNAVIDAVCWKGTLSKIQIKPEEGLEVICTGRLTTYPARSNYQLIIESMELAGEGALLKMLEERKKKLAAEGLFDPDRKKPLPFLPQVIGVVTSPTGAVIRDIIHRLRDRFPCHVLVWPALVQGNGAAEQIAAGINGFNALPLSIPKPDILIVARGGGSLEDLMPFNEEIVVRAVAGSSIPVISAVGHETDTTLCDFAADLRAPTPTGAAEMAVPVRTQLLAQILDDEKRLLNGLVRFLSEQKNCLNAVTARIGNPATLMEFHTQKLDMATQRLQAAIRDISQTKIQALLRIGGQLRTPRERLNLAQRDIFRWEEKLTFIGKNILQDTQKKVDNLSSLLTAYSFENVLRRGYVVVQNTKGNIVTAPEKTHGGESITMRFSDNRFLRATIDKGDSAPSVQQDKKITRAEKQNTKQESLF